MLVQTSFDSHRDSSKAQLGPHITVINHDVDKGSLLGPPLGASRGSSGGSSMVMGIPSPRQLSRQGSSVESTAIVPLHHASVQQATTFSKVQKSNALFFELTLIWGHAYLCARFFKKTLIWGHAYLSARLFERTLIWARSWFTYFATYLRIQLDIAFLVQDFHNIVQWYPWIHYFVLVHP